jgi:hypothetical protein
MSVSPDTMTAPRGRSAVSAGRPTQSGPGSRNSSVDVIATGAIGGPQRRVAQRSGRPGPSAGLNPNARNENSIQSIYLF